VSASTLANIVTSDTDVTDVEFWVDPICPWCWVTANWIVTEVAPRRNLRIIHAAHAAGDGGDPVRAR
jgi:hypothetical protein